MARNHEKKKVWPIILGIVAVIALAAGLLVWKGVPGGGRGSDICISELMAGNSSLPNENGVFCDWIEVQNSGKKDADLTGWSLIDPSGVVVYTFPQGSTVPAGGCCAAWVENGYALPTEAGQTFTLRNAKSETADAVTTVLCGAGQSEVRQEDGSLQACDTPTPGYSNDEAGLTLWNAVLSGRMGGEVLFSEAMSSNVLYASPDGLLCDWIEVYNPSDKAAVLTGYQLREDDAAYTFPEGAVLPGGGYLVIWCRAEAVGDYEAPFGLSRDGGETVTLISPDGQTADSLELPAMEKNASYALMSGAWDVTDKATPGYSNDEAGYEAYRAAGGCGSVSLAISEVMARNKGVLTDGDGDFSDWIEVQNTGSEAVSLEGWYLSDSADALTGWAFPGVTVESGEYLVVYASGKDKAGDELHTSFSLNSDETLYLVTPAGMIYAEVELSGLQDCCSMALRENGTYASTAWPTPGFENTSAGYISFASQRTAPQNVCINEAVVSPVSGNDWVELWNNSGADVDLTGWTIADKLTDATPQSLTGTLPAGGYLKVECTAFGLNSGSDEVYLCDAAGTMTDYVHLHDIPAGGSMGRMSGEDGFFLFTTPTPSAANGSGYRMKAEKPLADLKSGVYVGETGLSVTLSGEGTIYYTTDGSTPTESSAVYTSPVPVSGNTVIRAICAGSDMLTGPVASWSYLTEVDTELPVVSLVADPDDLFGAEGIYTNHEMAWRQKWTREGSIAFFDTNGESFSINCGLSIHGRTSRRTSEKRSFTVKFKDKYEGKLFYDVFGDGAVTEFSSLLLRASVEDNYTSYMRDELFARLAMDNTEVPAQNYRYAALYINGEYWGMYAIREHHSENYFATHYGVDADTVDMQTGEFRGTTAWNDLLNYVTYNSLSDETKYAYVESRADIDEIIDWLILECWSGDIDVYENVRFYASPDYNDGRYMFGLADMDLTMMNEQTYSVGFGNNGAQVHSILSAALLGNQGFREKFLTRLGESLQGYLSDENVLSVIDQISSSFESETAADLTRWGKADTTFSTQMEHLRTFTTGRAREMVNGAMAKFGLSAEQARVYFGDLVQ